MSEPVLMRFYCPVCEKEFTSYVRCQITKKMFYGQLISELKTPYGKYYSDNSKVLWLGEIYLIENSPPIREPNRKCQKCRIHIQLDNYV